MRVEPSLTAGQYQTEPSQLPECTPLQSTCVWTGTVDWKQYIKHHTHAHTRQWIIRRLPQEATRPLVPYLCFLCLCPSAVASAWPGSPASTTPGSSGSCRRGSHGTWHPQQLAATTADSLLLLNGCCNPCLCLSTHHLRLAGGHFHMHLRMPCCLTPLPLPPTIHSCPLFPSPAH